MNDAGRALWALVTFTMLVQAGPRMAEGRARPTVEWGVHYSTVSYDRELPPWRNGWRPSFTAGASVELPLGRRFGLSPGVRYVQKGNRVRYDSGPPIDQVGEYRIVQDYLAVPCVLQMRPFSSRRIAFSVGPELAFLLSAHQIVQEEVSGAPRTEYADIRDAMEDVDLSLEAGLEYALPLENHEGFLRLRYSHGLVGAAKATEWFSDWSTRGVQWLPGMRW